MRHDVKLGFAIGGVLLAVVIVFALVNSSKPADVPTDATAQTDSAPEAAAPAVVDTGRVTPPAGAATTVTPTPPAATTGDAFARTSTPAPASTDPWQDALNTGRLPAPPALMNSATTSTSTPVATGPTPTTPVRTATPEAPTAASSNTPAVIGGGVNERTGTARVSLPPGRIQEDADRIIAAGDSRAATSLSQPTRTTLAPTAFPARTHTIKSGETFSTIATAYYGHIRHAALIAKANPGVNSSRLKIGQVINLPAFEPKPQTAPAPATVDTRTQYRVKAGESLYAISMKLYGSPRQVDAIYAANKSTIGPDARKLKPDMVLQLPTPPSVAQK